MQTYAGNEKDFYTLDVLCCGFQNVTLKKNINKMSEVPWNMDSDSDEPQEESTLREQLPPMTLDEILQMKEELGAKVYNEAILGIKPKRVREPVVKTKLDLKRSNKNCPREMPAKRQVPFLGVEKRKKSNSNTNLRDPRFDPNAGEFQTKNFKENYKFLMEIREREIQDLLKKIKKCKHGETKQSLRLEMQKLKNKNLEERKYHERQQKMQQESRDIKRMLDNDEKPHFLTKKERRAKELVEKFEALKQTGKLDKHLEKRRKKNAAKDRKKISLNT